MSEEERQQVEAFLRGEPDTVRLLAGWAGSVIRHDIWGFESPEDIVQATLLALVQNLRRGHFQGGNLRAYTRRIAKNMCIDRYDRDRRRGVHVSLEGGPEPAARLSGETLERTAQLQRILDRLDEVCREIIRWAYFDGYSRAEIGQQLGITTEAARVRLYRCISGVRGMLARADPTVVPAPD